MPNFLSNLFNSDKKRLKTISDTADKIDALKDQMAALSDEELKARTPWLKERLANGESLDDILVDAYATVREAAKRVIGEFPYHVQLMGGIVLHGGDIAEMKTGEGKTLTSILPVYLNALAGKGVHIVTVNEYLSERDSEWMGQIHRFLGLSVGLNLRRKSTSEKRDAYNADITYTTNSELGFDYLRDNMVTNRKDRVLRGLNMALVDEVDSILIDESRTPLIISGGRKQTANLYQRADAFVKKLSEEKMEGEEVISQGDYTIDVKSRTAQLTQRGAVKAQEFFHIANLYDLENTNLVHHINQALKAVYVMARDVEYVVENDSIIIVDQFTGRKMEGRQYSDGLHQAIEAKEHVTIKEETTTLATITYQNFFRLYSKLCGMTGTAKTEEEEFLSIYNMRVLEIPTNKPVIRTDYPDMVYGTKKAKFEALAKKVMELHEAGQPVLVGTIAVETSELVSKMLRQRRVPHEVLNAKQHEREALIIAKAGKRGAVTIATNMAGRGTDIKLGEGVKELGGLAVLGSERHESRRIDNQLRGRSGRQGDPGLSVFFVSVQDDLMVRFGSERLSGIMSSLGDVPVESKMITNAITSAQKRVEGVNFDTRKALLEYDDVLRQQREIIYDQRNYILDNDDVHAVVLDMFEREMSNVTANYTDNSGREPKVLASELADALSKMGIRNITAAKLENLPVSEAVKVATQAARDSYERTLEPLRKDPITLERYRRFEKEVVLRTVDRAWIDHIDTMSKLREGIHLRAYAQSNPLQAYVEEGYQLFEDMMARISQEVVQWFLRLRVQIQTTGEVHGKKRG
ncbi:MAG: preprotein translocase subunit SecA [Erysipelotrichaceae bacterium]|nr:preprotein translocase subunit SecA [Erysipelotrichaceae bacterium]